MRIQSLLVANHAQVVNGLLVVEGGGWEYYSTFALPDPITAYVCGVVAFKPDELERVHRLDISIWNDDRDAEPLALAQVQLYPVSLSVPFAVPLFFVATSASVHTIAVSTRDLELTTVVVEIRAELSV